MSTSGTNLQMFLQAYNKAEQITNYIFDDTKTLGVCLSFYSSKTMLISSLSIFRNFKDIEISIPKESTIWYEKDIEDEELYRCFVLFQSNKSLLQRLLWGALASDLGISPKLFVSVHIFDLNRGILVHPYDDRGMDVIGSDDELIHTIYNEYNHYLLDYDRLKMEKYYKNFNKYKS